jgi:hypothetical protein
MLRSKSLIAASVMLFLHLGSVPAAIVSGYKLDETFGDVASDSVRGAAGDGTLSKFSGLQWVPGKIGTALEFDGDDSYVLAPTALPTGTTAFTISLWAWADTLKPWGSLVKNWGTTDIGAFHLGLDASSGRLSNYLGSPQDGPILAPTTFTVGTWHHIAVTWDGPTQTEALYVDGVRVATRLTVPGLTSLTERGPNMAFGVKPDNLTLGPGIDCCSGFWDGRMDDIAFFDTALTDQEVLQIKINGDNGISAIIPEPATVALAGLGISGLGFVLRRRRPHLPV